MTLTLTFHGAAGTVTGSCFRLRTGRGDVVIDCGLFQGTKTVRELNYRPFPFEPAELRAVLLTHAHIDHSGLLPKLTRLGYRGPVYATSGTVDLLEYMLPDSGYIQETEVERLNRRNRQRGRAAVQPIYTEEDARAALKRLKPVAYDRWVEVIPGVRARFWQAGHLLGSASVEVAVSDERGGTPVTILFSGDLGPGRKAFHEDPESPVHPDWLVMETTYGDREREELDHDGRRALLAAEVRAALEAGGPLLIPVFAVERTQELLFDLDHLFDTGVLPPVEVFLDSPLADAVTGVFRRHLGNIGADGGDPFVRSNFHRVLSVEESQKLNGLRGNAIIMAASGMCDAGRIRHHLKNQLWRPEATVLLVGYQAPGTLGHTLRQGAARVRIHGEEIEVRARIRALDVYSGHADRDGLLTWLEARQGVGRGLFLVHGEPGAREAFRQTLLTGGWPDEAVHLPDLDETVDLTQLRPQTAADGVARLPAAALGAADWHNRYAETLLELGEALRAASDDRTREHLLERVRRAIPQ